MCSNEPYGKVRVDQYLYDNFPILSGLEKGDVIQQLLFSFVVEYAYHLEGQRKAGVTAIHLNVKY